MLCSVETARAATPGPPVVTPPRPSPNSFRVAWVEHRYQDGALTDTARWTAILTVAIQAPTEADKLRRNPLGIYVNAINWSKELGQ
jgi:type IV secretion system protein VirB5